MPLLKGHLLELIVVEIVYDMVRFHLIKKKWIEFIELVIKILNFIYFKSRL